MRIDSKCFSIIFVDFIDILYNLFSIISFICASYKNESILASIGKTIYYDIIVVKLLNYSSGLKLSASFKDLLQIFMERIWHCVVY